ncbi:beta-lactamase-like protein [Methanospirillum hungatei JF-1]|uniref:Beta-lactamase-like protein n=1 Tax=Methanospirillum hungatei JF-1 (strain ATCC 27890 / DSM 864 / NBRC 100397 / JF-1) TaxID=323259 RepID=Q2FQ88_METHJ|nr:MBL fold metallo-hydrolase [Methanospirillum hungatei]ABD40659.1 beta-lactamase-like protein [Methanospirillum hungatei JF-1]
MSQDRNEFFVIRIPDTGSLLDAVRIIAASGLTITRCHFNRSLDPVTAFFSVSGDEWACTRGAQALLDDGYLQTTVTYPKSVQFTVIVPEIPGTLHRILTILDTYNAEISSLSFDNRGKYPDALHIMLRVLNPDKTEELIRTIEAEYPVKIEGYDCGDSCDDGSLFYVRYAARVSEILDGVENPHILELLHQFSHVAQQLTEYGKEYQDVLEQILLNGKRLKETTGDGFYADVQKIALADTLTLYCFQLPGGGSIFVIDAPDERIMIDTGYGIYHEDVLRMFAAYGLGGKDDFTRIILTHGDTDHCGAAGFFNAPVYTHEGTWDIIKTNNRAWGATTQDLVLEQVYTVMINLFARMTPPEEVTLLPGPGVVKRGEFPVLSTFNAGGYNFEILEGHGGHQHGLIYILCKEAGVLFTSDTILNLKHLSPERSAYNNFAVYLVTTVNVDPDLVKSERKALAKLALELDQELQESGKRLLYCCGHGPVSVMENGELTPVTEPATYRH